MTESRSSTESGRVPGASAYDRLLTKNGHMLVVAADQRRSMLQLMPGVPAGASEVARSRLLLSAKHALTDVLGVAAPAILLDWDSVMHHGVSPNLADTALVIGIDASEWNINATTLLRESQVVRGVDIAQAKKEGADAIKMLFYFRPDLEGPDSYPVNLMEELLADCNKADILLIFEILVYQAPNEDTQRYEDIRPDLIAQSAEVARSLGAKVLKLQYPGSVEACHHVTQAADGVPWALLSAGVTHDAFLLQVGNAIDGGASGIMAGRALWGDCLVADDQLMRTRLSSLAVPRLSILECEMKKRSHESRP